MLSRYLASVIDFWLLARRAAVAFWHTYPNDFMGYAIMRGLGIRHPNRVVDAGDVRAALVEDPRVDRYFRHQVMAVKAQTYGRYVFSREPLDDHTLAHEIEHVRQHRRFGPLFPTLNGLASCVAFVRTGKPYWYNYFEVAARRRADHDTAATRDS